jgi:hypothetical protein
MKALTIDKSSWPPGPWHDEPDRLEWRTATGLPALMRRGSTGAWCGYVAVPPWHPCHGVEMVESNAVDVHGGVTYAAPCHGDICHVPTPGESDDVFWIGFDCAHAQDLTPNDARYGDIMRGAVYRPLAYVRAECERLALQLVAIEAVTGDDRTLPLFKEETHGNEG